MPGATMTDRELDVEIARLDGCPVEMKNENPFCPEECGCHRISMYDLSGIGQRKHPLAHYASDLNALMTLIRRRWPGAGIQMDRFAAYIAFAEDEFYEGSTGDTDAQRLAHAVLDALRAEQEAKSRSASYKLSGQRAPITMSASQALREHHRT